MTSASGYLVRIELRRRLRTTALLVLLVAVISGTVLASVAGARRSHSALERYLGVVNLPEVLAFGDPTVLETLGDLTAVEAVLPMDVVAVLATADFDGFYPMAVSLDGRIPADYFRLPVLEGRTPDPTAPLEVALGERTAARLGARVGDELDLVSFTEEAVAQLDAGAEPDFDGPTLALEVVGIVRDPGDIGSRESDLTLTFLSPAFRQRYPLDTVGSLGAGAFVALAPGYDIPELSSALADDDVELDTVLSGPVIRRQAGPTMDTIARSLQLFGAIAALAGVATIAHVIARIQQNGAADDRVLMALGLSHRERLAHLAAPGVAAVVVGTLLGVAVAVALSPRFPIGAARRAEPDPGLEVDGPVLAIGALVALVLGSALVTVLASLAARRAERPPVTRPSRAARVAADLGAPAPTVVGVAFTSSSTGVPARTAAMGTLVAVVGVVAVTVVVASLQHLQDDPRLYGWGWDANIAGAELSDLDDGAVDPSALLADDDLSAVGEVTFQVPATIEGIPEFAIVTTDVKGHLSPVVVRGLEPESADEVALGGDTLRRVGADIGDLIQVDLGSGPVPLRITGVVAMPVSGDGGTSGAGAHLTDAAARRLGFTGSCGSCYRNVAIVAAPGVAIADLVERYSSAEDDVAVDLPAPPGEIERLTAVEDLPLYVAGLLAVLGSIAVTYAVAMTVRRRQGDLGILRALGMTGGQLRGAVIVQVLALTIGASLVGAVLGIGIGRQIWRAIADSVSMPFAPMVPAATAVVPFAAIALAQVAATLSRRAAGRTRAAAVLRAE